MSHYAPSSRRGLGAAEDVATGGFDLGSFFGTFLGQIGGAFFTAKATEKAAKYTAKYGYKLGVQSLQHQRAMAIEGREQVAQMAPLVVGVVIIAGLSLLLKD